METGCYIQFVSTLLANYSSQQDLEEHIILIGLHNILPVYWDLHQYINNFQSYVLFHMTSHFHKKSYNPLVQLLQNTLMQIAKNWEGLLGKSNTSES